MVKVITKKVKKGKAIKGGESMQKKGYALLAMMILLLFCQTDTAAAAPVEFAGIGTVDLGDAVQVKEGGNPSGGKDYKLLVKDGSVWRGLRILAAANLPESGALDPVFVLNQVIEEKAKGSNIIESEEAKAITVNGWPGASGAVKMTVEGWVMNLDLVYVKSPSGIKMMAFACADGDTPYWRPVIRQIIASLKG